MNINSQKVTRIHFIQNNVVIAAESEIRMIDASGHDIYNYFIDKNNGTISDMEIDS